MEQAIVLNTDDIRHILADYFNINVSDVVKTQNSYIVIGAKISNAEPVIS